MKILSGIVALLGFYCAHATAQSDLALFGMVDAALKYGKGNTAQKLQLGGSGYQSSRLGFRGMEDLGGGWRAGFWIEAALNNDDGTGAQTNPNNQVPAPSGTSALVFNRRSVLIVSGPVGELRLGREYTPHFWNHADYDAFGAVGVGTGVSYVATFAIYGGSNTPVGRASNAVQYTSPSMAGWKMQLMGYLGENASSPGTREDVPGRGVSMRATYDAGPLSAGFGWGRYDKSALTHVTSFNTGAAYDLGVVKVMGVWSLDRQAGVGGIVRGLNIGARVPFGPGFVRAALSASDNGETGALRGALRQFALGYVYDLSKRTALYTHVVAQRASGVSIPSLNGSVGTAGSSARALDVGIRQSF